MKITAIEDLHAASGTGQFSFLKISTDEGLVGWAEFNEGSGSKALRAVIHANAAQLVGKDPLPVQKIATQLYQQTVQAPGGMNQRANAAIEMALWDIRAKALGVPVYALFGGPVRTSVPVYWSHCGSYRMTMGGRFGTPEIHTPDDISALGAEVRAKGFKGLKTNCFHLIDGRLTRQMQGYGGQPGHAALNLERQTLAGIVATLGAFRAGAGPGMNLHLDCNYHFKSEGYIRIARAIEQFDMTWLEMDMWDAPSLADIRQKSPVPIASLEFDHGAAQLPPVPGTEGRRFRHHRSLVERLVGVAEDRVDGRKLRAELRAAQLSRPPLHRDLGAFLRRGAEHQGDGDRHRQRPLA